MYYSRSQNDFADACWAIIPRLILVVGVCAFIYMAMQIALVPIKIAESRANHTAMVDRVDGMQSDLENSWVQQVRQSGAAANLQFVQPVDVTDSCGTGANCSLVTHAEYNAIGTWQNVTPDAQMQANAQQVGLLSQLREDDIVIGVSAQRQRNEVGKTPEVIAKASETLLVRRFTMPPWLVVVPASAATVAAARQAQAQPTPSL